MGPETDYNTSDDATAIWWDPDATGEDEAGNEGTGQLVYVDGGHRYLPGEWPTDADPVVRRRRGGRHLRRAAEPDAPPEYPAWPGSPAAG